jgi:hypothetical protein
MDASTWQKFQISVTYKAGFKQAASTRLHSQAILHFEVVWLHCAATVEKKISPAR